ncbi:MAG TPA: tetratricopeptide repeat protein [Spirochaetia bacterium]|nr:tetratricopeptide repeat protein [Spirochaetia bacterium]
MTGPFGRFSRESWVAVIVVVSALAVGAAIFLGLRIHETAFRQATLSGLLSDADRAISGGFYPRASQDLQKAMQSATTREAWLSIAKRGLQIAHGSGNYDLLRAIGREATKDLPGSQELWAIRVLAELRTGRYASARQIAGSRLSDPRFESLKTEALLRAYPGLDAAGLSLSGGERQVIETIASRDPGLFEALARQLGNQDLLFDASLLYAWKGEMDQAYSVLVGLQSQEHPIAGMLLSYDADHLDSALGYYSSMTESQRTPQTQLLADDILAAQERYDDAASGYQAFVKADPTFAWTPYADLAWLAASGKSKLVTTTQAVDALKPALAAFPKQPEIVLSYAWLAGESGDTSRAESALEAYLKNDPGSLDVNLLHAELSGGSGNPESLRAALWQLYYGAAAADRARVARYLGWYLFGLHDFGGLRQIFKMSSNDQGDEWLSFYQGVYDGLNKEYASGITQFQRAFAIEARWQTLYNMGILELKDQSAQAAESDFQKADSALIQADQTKTKSPERALVHVGLAQALVMDGNTEGAKRELLYALDMDPGNIRAELLLQKLDSAP